MPLLRIVKDSAPHARDTSPDAQAGTSPDVVFIIDAEGTVLYVNRSLPGVHQDDVLGTSIYEYVLPDHHPTVRSSNARVFATGEVGGYEVLGMAGIHSESWYDCRVVPTLRGGRVVSATIIARDITIRKRIEEGLRRELDQKNRELDGLRHDLSRVEDHQSRESAVHELGRLTRFRTVLDQAGEAVFIVDPHDGRILDANGTACRWVSHTLEDLLTQKEADLRLRFPLRVPESYGDHVTETRHLQRSQLFRGEHRRADGSCFPVEVAITRHHIDGYELGLAIARDAKSHQQLEHALSESEDRYRALFELSRDAIYLSNRDGTIAEVNEAAVLLFGYSEEQFQGFRARDLYADSEHIRQFQKTVARDGFVRDMEVTLIRADGTHFQGQLTATLRHAGRHTVLGYQVVIRQAPVRTSVPAPPSRQTLEAAAQRSRGTVLLMDHNEYDRSEVKKVLELAGIRVLVGESLAEALIIFRARAQEIGVVLIAGAPEEIVEDSAFQEIRRTAPHARVILLTQHAADERVAVEYLAAANLSAVVHKPFHPLALIQHVREALEMAHPSSAVPRPTPRTSRGMPIPTE